MTPATANFRANEGRDGDSASIDGRNRLPDWTDGAATPGAESEVKAAMRPELESRLSRSRSARISPAVWHRSLGSFSRALLMSSSSRAGKSGLRRTG